jgi:uncharacterized membrane protein
MTNCGHLWAIGFDGTGRAAEISEEIAKLAWEKHELVLLDMAVAVRWPDGCLTLNGEPFRVATYVPGGSVARFLASLVLGAPPLTGAAVGVTFDCVGAGGAEGGIRDEFVREVAALIKPGASVLFVLDDEGNMDEILHSIRGLGGTVLKTNVDAARARLIQSTLAGSSDTIQPS